LFRSALSFHPSEKFTSISKFNRRLVRRVNRLACDVGAAGHQLEGGPVAQQRVRHLAELLLRHAAPLRQLRAGVQVPADGTLPYWKLQSVEKNLVKLEFI